MKRLLTVLFLLACQIAGAAEITITGPTKPINPGRMVRLLIGGLTEQELLSSKANVAIPEGIKAEDVDIFPGKTWSGVPYIDFMSQAPGKYLVSIESNEFRRTLSRGLAETEAAAIGEEYTADLRIAVKKITDKFVAKSGSALVEVAGTVPPPPGPGPGPPLPPTSGMTWTVVIRTVDTMTADQAQVLSDLRQWTDQQPFDKVSHLEFPPDAVGPGGEKDARVASWVAKIPATAKQPYVFISQKGVDSRTVIHWQGELPATADVLIAKIKELVK